MAEMTMNAEMMERFLRHTPGILMASRLDPRSGKSEWIYVSPKIADLYGIPFDVILSDPFSLLSTMAPEDRAAVSKQLEASFTSLTPLISTGRVQHPNGEVRWVESQSTFVREPDGSILSFGQMLDVTERKRTEAALAEAETARGQSEALFRQVIAALPVGIIVMNPDGTFPVYNPAASKYAGRAPEKHAGDLTRAFGVFETDGVTPFPNERLPLLRTLAGEASPEAEMIVRNEHNTDGCWVHVNGTPIRDADGKVVAGMVSFIDVTTQRTLERELLTRNEQLSASEEAKTQLIERLRYAIDELSNPILEVWDDVLAMPIIGVVDSRRTADMVQRLLAEVARTQASFVIVDLTGVEVVDTKTADHLIKLIRKVELVGARCVLTGIRPAVAETLVDIGVDFGSLTTLRNLKHGLREAFRASRRDRDWAKDAQLEGVDADEGAARRRGRAS